MVESITGIRELQQMLERGQRAPAKVLTKAAKMGAKIPLVVARQKAPVDTGKLKRGIRLFSEKRKTGKKVYQLAFNRNMNDVFAKTYGNGKRAYYPASMEYGFKNNRGSFQGLRFMREALQSQRSLVEQTIVNELASSLRALGW
jgi:hypothetical protein